jgi:competence protein ComEC
VAVGLIVAPAIGAALGRSTSRVPALSLTLLSVGDGQCAVIEIPGSQPLVVDAGGGGDVAHDIVEPYLHFRGISGIAGLILTHATAEHLSGAADLIDQENPQIVLVGPDFDHTSQYDPAAQEVADHLQQAGIEARVCRTGTSRDFGPVNVAILWPPTGPIPRAVVVRHLASGRTSIHLAPAQSGDESMVLRITYAGRSILFCSDISNAAMQQLLRHRDELACDVMIAPSGGGWCKWTHDFVTGIQPGLTLASSGHILGPGQQQFDDLMADRPFLRTGVHGAITVTITPEGKISENSWRP